MSGFLRHRGRNWVCGMVLFLLAVPPTSTGQEHESSSSRKISQRGAPIEPSITGTIRDGVYRNAFFEFSCKIPAGWVLRTDEMNRPDVSGDEAESPPNQAAKEGRVLLAAFSRPPLALGEDINSSIVIAAESLAAYPGMKDAAQYFGAITEIAKDRGFRVDEEPYEFQAGSRTLARGDYERDVGSRVMHQSTLVLLSRGYALSFTFIGGTDDEIDELTGSISFAREADRGK